MDNKIIIILILIVSSVFFFNCKNEKKAEAVEETTEIKNPLKVINIVTRSMEFQMQDTIASGWNTFKYDNLANETHFFRFVKLPEGITIKNFIEEADPVFEEGMDLINAGKPEEGFAAFGKMPEWFSKAVPSGGSGLIAPKSSAISTLYLEPGLHSVECYVKMPNGKFHSTMGMVKEVYVTVAKSEQKPPIASDTITIKEDGFHYNPDIRTGKHTFMVNIESQKLHENFATTDVHLVKLSENSNMDKLEAWMVWYDPKGFITPVPAGLTFMGGYNDDNEGSVGYFEVDLKLGNYALVAEVPNAKSKGLLKTFEVID
ncbi:hypothetical protein ACGK9U_13000 [Mariniflexile sp. HNIBRBA6329]|uniref:hypothetical protein n=1 Tax=Mariniflexile sp. HNIBRBA6329 TaxID=3373088 RepID=UPI003746C782